MQLVKVMINWLSKLLGEPVKLISTSEYFDKMGPTNFGGLHLTVPLIIVHNVVRISALGGKMFPQ